MLKYCRPSQLVTIEKNRAFLLEIAVLLVKKEKLKKKNNFSMILLAIIHIANPHPI
jgi:hypothetical protein